MIFAVCAVVLVVQWPALSAQTLFFDDAEYLTNNPLVQNPSRSSAWRFLNEVLEPSTVHGYYQPLTMISLMFDYAIGGRPDNLRQFHRTSLALHVANTALVIILLYLLFGQALIAAGVGLLFGLHPITVESIPWVGERKTLLAAFFALWCLVFYVSYIRKSNWKFLICCILMYIFALMSKPTTVPLPAMLLLLDFWPLRRMSKRSIIEKIPLFCIGIIFVLITVVSQSRTASVTMPGKYGPERIILVLCHNIVFYLNKIIWPSNLCPYYPFPNPISLSHPMILTGVTGTVILLLVLLLSLRWTRALLTGWLFFFIAILPTMGIIGFTVVIASDKYAYLPLTGLLMILVWLLQSLCMRIQRPVVCRVSIVFFILILAVAESVATRRCLGYWQNNEAISQLMLDLVSDSPQVYSFAAVELARQDRNIEAIENFKKAIEIGHDSMTEINYKETVTAHYNLGVILVRQNRLDEAIEQFSNAVQLRKSDYDAHLQLAHTLVRKGHLDRAIEHYNQALRLKPGSADIHNRLGLVLSKQGKSNEAIAEYRRALQHEPGNVNLLCNLGSELAKQGIFNEAIEQYNKAIELEPQNIIAHGKLGLVLGGAGRIDEAIKEFRIVLAAWPDDAEMYCNIGILLEKQGKLDEAINEYRKALQVNPEYTKARNLLDAVLVKQQNGQSEKL